MRVDFPAGIAELGVDKLPCCRFVEVEPLWSACLLGALDDGFDCGVGSGLCFGLNCFEAGLPLCLTLGSLLFRFLGKFEGSFELLIGLALGSFCFTAESRFTLDTLGLRFRDLC